MTVSFLFPTDWPLWARRAFVMTLPISGPALAAVWMLCGAVLAAICAGVAICVALAWIVTPIVTPIIWIWDACCDLWFDVSRPANPIQHGYEGEAAVSPNLKAKAQGEGNG